MKAVISKSIIPVIFYLFASSSSQGQTLSSHVISPAGGYATNNEYSLEWTIGETVANSYLADNVVYTQGFNQSYLVVARASKESTPLLTRIVIAPNPVLYYVNVQIENKAAEISSVIISDANGKQVLKQRANQKTQNLKINMSLLPQGQYVLQVLDARNSILNTTRLIKM